MAKRKRAESRARYYIRELSKQRGWGVSHPSRGGDCLEEQEIVGFFPDIGLGLEKPDFLFSLQGSPCMVIEAKNTSGKIHEAVKEAIDYANLINQTGKYDIKLAVGAAGEEDCGFSVVVRYRKGDTWLPLTSNGFEITSIPSKKEAELAFEADDATTNVQVPSIAEFIESAIELSIILGLAKVEAPLRPRVIGAIVLSMYQGEITLSQDEVLDDINRLVAGAINESVDLDDNKKNKLKESLQLLGGDYERLSPYIARIVSLLKRLNIRSVLQTDTDFLGLFYEAFLRYGYDNKSLGIVFTPRHITRFCVDLVGAKVTDRVIDVACGTGGFLVAAFDRMFDFAHGPKAIQKVKQPLYGYDTNPTIWALSTLNMFFRGDGKTHIENGSCFDPQNINSFQGKFTRAFLNPPFSQEGEPERDFIDISMKSLEPEGILAVIVKAGIFADDDNKSWREEFTRNHTVLGVISLPEELFYPTAAPTSILLAQAHIPQRENKNVFMAKIWNDGYEKLKGKRVEVSGSQLPQTISLFHDFMKNSGVSSDHVTLINGKEIVGGNEWSPEQYLPNPFDKPENIENLSNEVTLSLYRAVAAHPTLADVTLRDFPDFGVESPFELNKEAPVNHFFKVVNGKSTGAKNYTDGDIPYISSGDALNSIITLVAEESAELFKNGGITVTAFGQAYVQPWSFLARGNGGSAVRVLLPKYKMSLKELIWFCAQINAQRWRFFYGRMSIKSRLERLIIKSPTTPINDRGENISVRLNKFRTELITLSKSM